MRLIIENNKSIETAAAQNELHDVVFHNSILEVLFKHKEEIYRKLIDLKGAYLIDHIAIKIIDPKREMLIFSITPSVEYNLITQGIWQYDFGFSTKFQKNNSFYPWQKAYSADCFNEIKQLKEIKHGFTFGFNISKKIDQFIFIYSFATRSKNNYLYDYYCNYLNELSELGDYGCKLIRGIYLKYGKYELPMFISKENYLKTSNLKLVINNEEQDRV